MATRLVGIEATRAAFIAGNRRANASRMRWWTTSILALSVACSTTHVSDLSKEAPARASAPQVRDGIEVVAAPLTNRAEIRSKFGVDLIGHGILPVFVRFKNQTSDRSVLVAPERCALMANGAHSEQTSERPESLTSGAIAQAGGAAVAVLGPLVLSPALIIGGAISATDALTANHQFVVNQLGIKTLSPSAGTAGYVYFRIPPDASALASSFLSVEVEDSSTGDRETFQFPLHFEVE